MTGSHQVPRLGDMVYYYGEAIVNRVHTVKAYAAFITDLVRPGDPESLLTLAVLAPPAITFKYGVTYGPCEPHCWGWPPMDR